MRMKILWQGMPEYFGINCDKWDLIQLDNVRLSRISITPRNVGDEAISWIADYDLKFAWPSSTSKISLQPSLTQGVNDFIYFRLILKWKCLCIVIQ